MAEFHSTGDSHNLQNSADKYSGKMEDGGARYAGKIHENEKVLVNTRSADYEEKRRRYAEKAEMLEEKLSRVEEKQAAYQKKINKPKVTHRFVAETERDSLTGREYTSFRIEKSVHDSDYQAPRGLMHKLNAHISVDKVGFVVPVVHVGGARKVELSEHSRVYRRVEMRQISAPKPVQKGLSAANKTLLGAENVLLKADDAGSVVLKGGLKVTKPFAFIARQKLTNIVYESAADNLGMKFLVKSGETASTFAYATRSLVNWSVQRKRFKQQKKQFKYERQGNSIY